MRILLVSDIDNPHTQQWATGLAERGIEIGIFSLRRRKHFWTEGYDNINVLYAQDQRRIPALGILNNFELFTYNRLLRKAVDRFRPDIIHAHNLDNHGLIAARANRHPLIVSAWGSDIFEHPHESIFHRFWTKYTLRRADRVLATSKVLAAETQKYSRKTVTITPFGIDFQHFTPKLIERKRSKKTIVIGSAKALKKVYNHEQTIRAFAQILTQNPEQKLQLLFAGDGPERNNLEALARSLGIESQVTFAGLIPYPQMPDFLARLDIFVNVSHRESFGVAVLEASAMELPVIAAKVEGLPEVVLENESGFLIDPQDTNALAGAMQKLIDDKTLRHEMGSRGRKFVMEKYDRRQCIDLMINIYNETLESSGKERNK